MCQKKPSSLLVRCSQLELLHPSAALVPLQQLERIPAQHVHALSASGTLFMQAMN